jgi:hypothetical protein
LVTDLATAPLAPVDGLALTDLAAGFALTDLVAGFALTDFVADLALTDLAAGFAPTDLAAGFALTDLAAGFAVAGFAVDFAVLRLTVVRLEAGLTRAGVPERELLLGPALLAPAGLVEALMAAAMGVFLRMTVGSSPRGDGRSSGLDRRVGAGLACLPCPAGVLCLPRRIALLDCFESSRRVVGGGVRTEPELRGTNVVPGLDRLVTEAPEVVATARPTVVHEITVHLKSTKRYRFGQKV